MSQNYSDPGRADDPHALPDIETFYVAEDDPDEVNEDGEALDEGWYWQACFPGCLPDGLPVGPFRTEREALKDAQDG